MCHKAERLSGAFSFRDEVLPDILAVLVHSATVRYLGARERVFFHVRVQNDHRLAKTSRELDLR